MKNAQKSPADFEQFRPYLMGLAYRLLGSRVDAEDAVQETWLRWQKQVDRLDNEKAWLTRVCTNLCIDTLRRLKRERQQYDGPWLPEPLEFVAGEAVQKPHDEELGQSLQMAYMLLLERLTPNERAAILLHDVFGFSFDEIAEILRISTATARQHASRGRRHLKASKTRFDAPAEELAVLGKKLQAAMEEGDLDGMISYLAEDVELWSDGGGQALAARNILEGPERVAAFLTGVFRKAPAEAQLTPGTLNGKPAFFAYSPEGQLATILTIACNRQGKIDHVLAHRNPSKLAFAEVTVPVI